MFSETDYRHAAGKLGLTPAHIKAFVSVEANGDGFNPDKTPKILFERHVFYRQLAKNVSLKAATNAFKESPDLCNPQPGGYGKYSAQNGRLERAARIDRVSALESCSWGAGQVMGYHWRDLGYVGLQDFVNEAYTSAGQLTMIVRFIQSVPGLTAALKAKDWPNVARLYNGPNYAINRYDVKLSAAYEKYNG